VYLWLTGLQMHHAEAAYCHPAGSVGCAINFTGKYGETAIIVSIALQAVPALIGAFAGAPVLARELGRVSYFSEFSPSGKLLFNAKLPDGVGTYRAYRLPWNPGS
jgi:hypothetical protein